MATQSLNEQIRQHIVTAIPDAQTEVEGGGGHFSIRVTSVQFEGKRPLDRQRLVLSAIAPLMKGPNAPLHAVDTLQTLTPQT